MAVSSEKTGNDEYEPLLRISTSSISTSSDTIEGVVDYKGEKVPSVGSNLGGWRSAFLIIGAEFGETIAYYGISSNLISYLTGPLGQSTAAAAANVNAWCGMVWMLPLLGAFVADSYLGRFRTIFFSSFIYVLGLGFLTLSAVLTSLMSPTESDVVINETSSASPAPYLVLLFFLSLYLVAIGKAGFKPCAEAFGADQFDERNPEESSSKSSFFNWWYFGLCVGSSISHVFLTYIQDNISWVLGFAIPCICMLVGLFVFLLGRKTYRFSIDENKENPISRIARVYVASARNWRATSTSTEEEGIKMPDNQLRVGADQFKFLDKALIELPNSDQVGSRKHGMSCSVDQVEDAKVVLRLVPIWTVCLIYAVVSAQSSTFFTKQACTMNRKIGQGFQIPPASLLTVNSLSIIIFIPIYDRLFVPFTRFLTKKHSGISMLQRIGCGMFISTIAMALAAIVEKKRLQAAFDFGLIDKPNEIVPISFWWLVPQYIMLGIAEVFAMVGLQEFFYDQVPDKLRSMGLSLYLSIFGIGDFLSSFLIYAIDKSTSGSSQGSWFPDNLNRAHLDYFYWLLAGLSAINLIAYLYVSKFYLYKRVNLM